MNKSEKLFKELGDLEGKLKSLVISTIENRAIQRNALTWIGAYCYERRSLNKLTKFTSRVMSFADTLLEVSAFEQENRTIVSKIGLKFLSFFIKMQGISFVIKGAPSDLHRRVIRLVNSRSTPQSIHACIEDILYKKGIRIWLLKMVSRLDYRIKTKIDRICLLKLFHDLRYNVPFTNHMSKMRRRCVEYRDKIIDAVGDEFAVIPAATEGVSIRDFIGVSKIMDGLHLIPENIDEIKDHLLEEICEKKREIKQIGNSNKQPD